MKTIAFAAALGCTFIASDCLGQNLSERINHVMNKKVQQESRNTSKAEILGTVLMTNISVDFNETPARDAFEYIQTLLGINMTGRYSDDRTGIGIDPELPVTLSASDQPALTVIEQMLDQCADEFSECTWQLRNGYFEFGTKERLSVKNAREIRYYPIRDLLFEPPNFDNAPDLNLDTALNQGGQGGGGSGSGGGGFGGGGSGGGGSGGGGTIFDDPEDAGPRVTEEERAQEIIELITTTVEPEAWDLAGGDIATIRYYQGVLIIRAPDYIQREIGGYPFAVRVGEAPPVAYGGRYVTMSGSVGIAEIADVKVLGPFGGSTGGN